MPKLVKRHVPAALLVPCPAGDRRPWKATRDIIGTATANGASLATCSAQIDGIREWDRT